MRASVVAVVIAVGGLAAGCAGESPAVGFGGAGPSGLGMASGLVDTSARDRAAIQPTEPDLERAALKSHAGRVLGALALERVTGLKPEPERLATSP